MSLPDILAKIIATKRVEIAAAKAKVSIGELAATIAGSPRSLAAALRRAPNEPIRVLAEIKRASPSAGPIAAGADPVIVARDYVSHGAAALSVLTDRDYFDGHLSFLAKIRPQVDVPLLRKDFIVDEYQVVEARAAGADAILLIAAALDDAQLAMLHEHALVLGMDVLVEVHDEVEAGRAVNLGATIIGINHRDLRTFTMDMELSARISLPSNVVRIAESGIRTTADLVRMAAIGMDAVLVGESLMRATSPGQALAELRG